MAATMVRNRKFVELGAKFYTLTPAPSGTGPPTQTVYGFVHLVKIPVPTGEAGSGLGSTGGEEAS